MQLQGPLAGSFQVCPPRPGGTQDYWRLRSSNRWWCGRACCLHMCAWRNGQDLNYCVNVSKFHTTHWRLIKEIYSTENRKVHKSICQGEHYALSYGIIAWSCCYRLILEVCIALPHTNNKNWKNEDHSKMFSVTNHLMKASFKCLQAESMKCEVSGVQRKEIKENKQRKYKTAKFLMRNYWSGLRDLFGNFSKLNKLYNQLSFVFISCTPAVGIPDICCSFGWEKPLSQSTQLFTLLPAIWDEPCRPAHHTLMHKHRW